MGKIISIHSFRGGTGKSNTTANLAVLAARAGKRVGVIDTDIHSPGIHVILGLDIDKVRFALNDYLWGRCRIEEAAHDMTAILGADIATSKNPGAPLSHPFQHQDRRDRAGAPRGLRGRTADRRVS